MNLWHETKSVPISRQMVWEAYKKVRSNQGAAGVDQLSMDEFDAERSKHLYYQSILVLQTFIDQGQLLQADSDRLQLRL